MVVKTRCIEDMDIIPMHKRIHIGFITAQRVPKPTGRYEWMVSTARGQKILEYDRKLIKHRLCFRGSTR